MSRRVILASLLSLGLFAPSVFAQTPTPPPDNPQRPGAGINAREHRQAMRIRQGVRNDELTRPELRKLRRDETRIRAEERRYRQSGDGLNRREVRDLQRDLNRTSGEIRRATHNNRDR